jgi:uncharacterized protein involved in cysteine biosynthesis
VSWSFYLLLIPTIAYVLAAMAYSFKGNWPLAVTYFGYAFANCGLLALDVQLAQN